MTKEDWETALRLLEEASTEISTWNGIAMGESYTGNEVADHINAFVARQKALPAWYNPEHPTLREPRK